MVDDELEKQNGDDETWEDPREKARDGATVIRMRCGRLDIQVFAPLLVEHAGIHRLDAPQVCARGAGILVDNISIDAAEALAEALQEHGEGCFVVPAAFVVPLPRAKPLHAARLTPSDLGPTDTVGQVEQALWRTAVALALARVSVETTQTVPSSASLLTRRMRYVGVGGIPGIAIGSALSPSTSSKTVTKSGRRTFLDTVFLAPLRRYRVDAGGFDYSILGKQLQGNSEANIQVLARWFLHAAGHMRTNFDTKQLMLTGQVDLPNLSSQGFEDLVHWLINLVRFGDEETPAEGEWPTSQ